MKSSVEGCGFQPIKVTFTLESKEEAEKFAGIINCANLWYLVGLGIEDAGDICTALGAQGINTTSRWYEKVVDLFRNN